MDNSIEALKVEQSVISKELARFRPCHSESRCYFCREWAQFVYKKHVATIQKTQDNQDQPMELKAGRYRLRLPKNNTNTNSDGIPVDHKEHARQSLNVLKQKLIEQVKNGNSTTATGTESTSTLAEDIISVCNAWIEAPSSVTTLNSLFEPVHFDPYDQALLEEENADPKEPGHLLNPLIVKRQNVYLPSNEFRLLKNLTGDVLLSHREAMCDHTRPEWKSPNDLDVERAIFNEKMDKEIKNELGRLEQALDGSWKYLTEFVTKLRVIDKERLRLLGKEECQKDLDFFSSKQEQTPAFQDYWTPLAGNFKKKQRNPVDIATVDKVFDDYFDQLLEKAEQFQKEFVIPRLEAVVELLKKLWELLMPSIRQMAERMAKFECNNEMGDSIGKRMKINSAKLVKSVENLDPLTDVKKATENIQEETELRIKEYATELDALKKAYKEGKPSVVMRLDKIANSKPFKKQIKKAEGGYHSIRQHFRYQLTQKIFPEPMFAKFCLVCVEALMQEGELAEVMTIESEMKRFAQEKKEMVEERQYLFEDFEDGIMTGRRELAGVMGRLFLKEGMRIQGENLAMQRQYSLLYSLGVKDVAPPPPGPSSPSLINDRQQQTPRAKQDSLVGKKKKTRNTKDTVDNRFTEKSLTMIRKDMELMGNRLEMLNKLCDSMGIDDEGEKTESPNNNTAAATTAATTTTPPSKPISNTSSSTTSKKTTTDPKHEQQKGAPLTSKASPSKVTIPKASSPKTSSPKTSSPKTSSPKTSSPKTVSPVSSKPVSPIIPPSKQTTVVSPTGVPKPSTQPTTVPAKPSTAAVVAAAAATAAAVASSKPRAPSSSMTKVTEPKASSKKTVPEPVTKASFPPLPQQEQSSTTVEKTQDAGGWGSTNAAQMVKSWNSSKDSIPLNAEKKQKQQKPITTAVKNNAIDEPRDDGWGAAPPVPKVDSQSDGWDTENAAAWNSNNDKIRQVVGDVSAGASKKKPESKKPITTADGWTEIPTKKKKQQEESVVTNDGWGASAPDANDGWGNQEKKEVPVANDGWEAPQEKNEAPVTNDGWEAPQEKKEASVANDGWEVVQEKKPPVPANNDGWEAPQEKKEAPVANDGWGNQDKKEASVANCGWGNQEKKEPTVTNNGWEAPHEKKEPLTNDGWKVVQEKKPPVAANNDGWEVVQEKKPSVPANNDGWGAPQEKKPSVPANNDGWGAPQEKKVPTNDGWDTPSKATPKGDSWGSTTANEGWGSQDNKQKATEGWGTSSTSDNWRSKEKKPTATINDDDDGWKSSSSPKAATDDGWGASSKAPANDGWGVSANDGWSKEGSNGWSERKSSTNRQSTGNNTRNRQQQQQQQQQPQQQPADKWGSAGNRGWGNTTNWNNQEQTDSHQSQSIPENGWDHNTQQQSQLQPQQSVKAAINTPPGMSAPGTPSSQQHSDTEVVNFSLKDILQQQPQAQIQPQVQPQQTTTISQPPGLVNTAGNPIPLTTPPPTTSNSSTLAPMGSVTSLSVSVAQHEQIPTEQMRTMTQDSLISFIQTLQRDNTRLLQSLIAGQQEMSLQTTRYTELMTLSRERETQLLQLFEARKQTEMEEARRYILSLEARISTLEGQLKTANTAAAAASAAAAAAAASNSNNSGGDMSNVGGATAGFGNQDLFAGYRESMRSNNNNNHRGGSGGRRYYNRQPPAVRCGNCGGTGHTSADCQDVCRYCGSQEHLSETCTMNQ